MEKKDLKYKDDSEKDSIPIFTITSQVISNIKCYPLQIHIYGSGADGYVILYNGTSAAGDKKITIPVKNGYDNTYTFPPKTVYDKGLYVELSSSSIETTIHI